MGIVGKSMLIALVIALPLGFFLSRKRGAATPVLIFLGILYTIPSFALLAFLVPFTGIGEQPAIIALTMYALVVLVRNTMVAFSGVDPDIIEAAQGMGMSGVQQVWKVEIPLALPVIVAGIRISTLSTISLTTIAAWIGAGGLGQLLKDGMSDPTYSKLWAGVICVAALAIASDLVLRWVERLVAVPTAKTRRVPGTQSSQPIIADMAQPKEA
jgi:osmoprotectant transport system permease protein